MPSTSHGQESNPIPKGYVVFDLEIHDAERYEAYRLDGQASIRRFGARVLSGEPAPRGVVEALEGDWPTLRLVIVEFPTIDIARAWFHSETYQAAARKRQASSTGRVLLVGGWDKSWCPAVDQKPAGPLTWAATERRQDPDRQRGESPPSVRCGLGPAGMGHSPIPARSSVTGASTQDWSYSSRSSAMKRVPPPRRKPNRETQAV